MNEVSLQTYLTQQPSMLEIVFPCHAALQITASEFMEKVTFINISGEKNEQAKAMLEQYIVEVSKRKQGMS